MKSGDVGLLESGEERVVHADSRDVIHRHLAHFEGIYAHDAIVEVRAPPSS